MERRKTGKILPRNYGLRLAMPFSMNNIFISPISYGLAQIMLESPGEIRSRISDYSDRHGENYQEILNEFTKGVIKREGTKNILNYARRTKTRQSSNLVLTDFVRRGGKFIGKVKSKSGDIESYHDFSLPIPDRKREINISYPGARVSTKGNLWNEDKGKDITVIEPHIAIPEIALYLDEKFRVPVNSNISALTPNSRYMKFPPTLPFTFNFFESLKNPNELEAESQRVLTDVIIDYYLNGTSQYDASIRLLERDEILSPELKNAIYDEKDWAQFKVMRQKEEEISRKKLNQRQDRRHAATTNLVEKITEYFGKKYNYLPAGKVREFIGTEYETVAQRFEPRGNGRGPIYSLVTSEDYPPLLIKRFLGHKSERQTSDNKNVPRRYGLPLTKIDDATRRECGKVEIILPEKKLESSGFKVPGNLKEEYDKLRS